MQLQTTNTYSRTFSMTPITPVFTLLISPLPHLLFMLQLLHKIIYVPRLPSILFPRSLLLLLQCAWKSFRTKYTYYLRTIWISAISILTFLSESFPLAAKGGGMKDGTYLQKSYSINFHVFTTLLVCFNVQEIFQQCLTISLFIISSMIIYYIKIVVSTSKYVQICLCQEN